MNMKPVIIIVLIIELFSAPICAQHIIDCNNNTTFWIITHRDIKYSVKLHGDIAESKIPELLNVEDMALQYVILDKKEFMQNECDDNDLSILKYYVEGEAKYLSNKFPKPFEVQMEIYTIPTGEKFLLWYYKLPEGKNKEVIAQIFISTIIDDTIIGFGSPQFIDHDFEDIKTFLVETISTLSVIRDINSLCDK